MSDEGRHNRKIQKFEDRFRLYLDESGDHVFRETTHLSHRYLCILGCWFANPDYLVFQEALEKLKLKHLHHHPDDPIVLHREDMVNARKGFKNLRDDGKREKFDEDLLDLLAASNFHVVAVVIDKEILKRSFGEAAAHPYHLGLGFLLQRYAGFLNHINRTGDVLGEARGAKEDRLLKESYTRVYERGCWMTKAHVFQTALTSCELKLRPKHANVAGLQLADLLGHPVKNWVLRQHGHLKEEQPPFAKKVIEIVEGKFNRHLYDGRIDGYGTVLYPK